MSTNVVDEFPLICITPLYHFDSDADELAIHDGIRIVSYDHYDGPQFDEVIGRYFQVLEPPFLLINDPVLSGDASRDDALRALREERSLVRLHHVLLYGTTKLFAVLRLFKPGRLRAGETFVVSRFGDPECSYWETQSSGRASTMMVDFQRLASQTTSYVLNSGDLSFLSVFRERVAPFMLCLKDFPVLETAFALYGAENLTEQEAVGTVTALEALISKKDEIEGLTYRLAMRAANLLGYEPEERKHIFRQIKQFYRLRSQIVHGVALDTKMIRRLDELESMRELLRRLLLSVMALVAGGIELADIPDLIDEMAFDEERRKEVQKLASAFLHI